MGFDSKYGLVETEFGDIPEDEPVIVFRGRDAALPELLYSYRQLCMQLEAPKAHVDLIDKSYQQIKEWQRAHPDEVRVPTSRNYFKRVAGEEKTPS